MRVAVYGQNVKEGNQPFIKKLFAKLESSGYNITVYAPYLTAIEELINPSSVETWLEYSELHQSAPNYLVTLGGDGTILNATTQIRDSGIPILGINLGRLGFLASTEKHRIEEAVDLMISGKYVCESRALLSLDSNIPIFGNERFALNDFTLHKRDTSSMINIQTFIDGEFLISYWADGVIVSTPTGSTGYSLSCGGPIILPGCGNFVITPVAPHNLTARPVVISNDATISFKVEGRTDNFLSTLDSRHETIHSSHQISIKKSDFKIKLVKLEGASFFRTIHEKLNWGADSRN